MTWGTIIAAYLFLAGVSAGAYLTAVNAQRLWPNQNLSSLRKGGVFLSIPVLSIGLFLLILDAEAGLHSPWRFIYLFLNFPGSMMTNGTVIISAFMLVLLACGWLLWKKKPLPNSLVLAGNLLAIGTAVYTGLLIGVVNTVPLWNSSILPILFLVSALSTGMAAAVITGLFIDKNLLKELKGIKQVHMWLLAIELLLIFSLFYITSSSSEVARSSVAMILAGKFAVLFWGGVITIGLLIPLFIEWYELGKTKIKSPMVSKLNLQAVATSEMAASSEHKGGVGLTITMEAMVLVGGFILRLIVLKAALPINILG